MADRQSSPDSIRWVSEQGGFLELIDQTVLPAELKLIACRDVEAVWEAIKMLRVRGAPAIGIAAAYGVCLASNSASKENVFSETRKAADYLATSRPTAVNLFWALDRMRAVVERLEQKSASPAESRTELISEASAIHREDREMCHAIGKHGAPLLADGSGVLTHCNAGGLATAEYGTALSVFFYGPGSGKDATSLC